MRSHLLVVTDLARGNNCSLIPWLRHHWALCSSILQIELLDHHMILNIAKVIASLNNSTNHTLRFPSNITGVAILGTGLHLIRYHIIYLFLE